MISSRPDQKEEVDFEKDNMINNFDRRRLIPKLMKNKGGISISPHKSKTEIHTIAYNDDKVNEQLGFEINRGDYCYDKKSLRRLI